MAYKLLGIEVDLFDQEGLFDLINKSVNSTERLIVASQNLHSIYIYHRNQHLRKLQEIAVKRIDGMPIILFGRLLGYPFSKNHRMTWVDLIYPLMERATAKNWSIFYLGADEESVSKGVEILKHNFNNLDINYRNGFFNVSQQSEENNRVTKLINSYNPDILIVGMGMPRQEKWILENKEYLNAKVIMTCGAAIEYVAGTVKTPPRWMGRTGLEWFYRLRESPNRFWYRYLIEPWFILGLLSKDITRKIILKKEI